MFSEFFIRRPVFASVISIVIVIMGLLALMALPIARYPEIAFEFARFTKRPKLGLAQSLFSHLTTDDIHLCLANLKSKMQPGGRFFATFVPAGFLPPDYENPTESDDKLAFEYDAEDILKIGRELGWQAKYIGDWGHPRGQDMLEFTVPNAKA